MRFSLSKINFLNIFFTALLFSVSIIYWEIHVSEENFKEQSARMYERYLDSKKELTKEQVEKLVELINLQIKTTYEIYTNQLHQDIDKALEIFTSIKRSSKNHSQIEILTDFTKALSHQKMRDDASYFFIFKGDSTLIYHGASKKFDGVRLFDIKEGSKELYILINQALREGESAGYYIWENPVTKKFENKFGYVRRIENSDYYIGTGFYTKKVDTKLQENIKAFVDKLRFGEKNDGYFWIHTLEGDMVTHPIQPFLDGESISNYKTSDGRYCFQEMNTIVRQKNEGFLEYLWKYPGSLDAEEKKISFVKGISHWDWVIGSGFYFREQLEALAKERIHLKNYLNEKIISLLLMMLIIFSGSMFIAYYISRKIKVVEEERLQHLNLLEQYKTAFDESSIVSKTDVDGVFTYVNKKFEDVSGYTKEELLGTTHNILRHHSMPKELFRDLWKSISSGKVWSGIIRNWKKNRDETYYINTTIIPIKDEFGEIVEYISASTEITELIEKNNKLENLMLTDSLTGLGSRVKLLNDLKTTQKEATLAIIDILKFTEINDTFGQAVGDRVIQEVADEIFEFSKDTTMKSYRLHADVFAILCITCNSNDFTLKVTNFIKYLKTMHFDKDEANVTFDFAAGISQGNFEALACADMALKNAKRNHQLLGVYSKDDSLLKEYQKNALWVKKVSSALEDDRILVYFQPIYSYAKKAITKYEVLVRLEDEDSSIVAPGEFLDIIKQTSLYPKLTQTVMRKSIDKFRFLRDKSFTINLTLEDLLNKETMQYFYSIVTSADIFKNVIIEIVESEELVNFDYVTQVLHEFKQKGSKIAIDDFGTGYSNYNYLRKLDVDFIKIDGSIIENIEDGKTKELIATIVDFAKKSDMQTVAEFVSSKEIYEQVQSLDIDFAQGYHIGKPAPLNS